MTSKAYPKAIVRLDDTGAGRVDWYPPVTSAVNRATVTVAPAPGQQAVINIPTANAYRGSTRDTDRIDGTDTGNRDAMQGLGVFEPSEALTVVWEGGDPGATATLALDVDQFDTGPPPAGAGAGFQPFTNSILAGNTLVRKAIQSDPYVAGMTGWAIFRDGTADLSDVTVRGLLFGGVRATSAGAGDAMITVAVDGDTFSQLQILADGGLHWGDGSHVQDLVIERSAPGELRVRNALFVDQKITTDAVVLEPVNSADVVLSSTVGAQTTPHLQVLGDGSLLWGDGTAAVDAQLYRAAAGRVASSVIVSDVADAPETWHTLALSSPWVAFGSGQLAPRVRLMPDGTVWIQGDAKTTAAIAPGTVIATLTGPYLPGSNCVFPVSGSGIPAGATLNVNTTGAVMLSNFTGSITVGLVGLAGLRFDAAGALP